MFKSPKTVTVTVINERQPIDYNHIVPLINRYTN